MVKSMTLSLQLARKSFSRGVSIGDGQTLFIRSPFSPRALALRSVRTCTHSLEKEYGSTPSVAWFSSNQLRALSQSSMSRTSLIGASRSFQRPPAVEEVFTTTPPGAICAVTDSVR